MPTAEADLKKVAQQVAVQQLIQSTPPATTLFLMGCAVCGKSCRKRCSVCHRVSYCDATCQAQDWPRHKQSCQQMKAGLKRVANAPTELKTEGGVLDAYRTQHPLHWETAMRMLDKCPSTLLVLKSDGVSAMSLNQVKTFMSAQAFASIEDLVLTRQPKQSVIIIVDDEGRFFCQRFHIAMSAAQDFS